MAQVPYTRLKFVPGLPGSTQGAFPLTLPPAQPPYVQITVLGSCSLPTFQQIFFSLASLEKLSVTFVGKVANALLFQATVAGVEFAIPPTFTKITILGSHSLPQFPKLFSSSYFNQLNFIGKVANAIMFQAALLGDEEIIIMTKLFCQQNDIGLQLIYQFVDQNLIPINLVGAAALKLKILYPDGTYADKTAKFYTNGTDGKITYMTISNDLSQIGLNKIQGKYTLGTQILSGQEVSLEVLANVDNN